MTAPAIDLDKFIEITSGVSGGKPRVAGRRITMTIVTKSLSATVWPSPKKCGGFILHS